MTAIGEIAALLTSVCFTTTSTFFSLAGRRVGPLIVNRMRLVIALALVSVTHALLFGSFLPMEATAFNWFWLGLSGIIGFVLGDIFLFKAFVDIGPRLSMLVMSLVPVIGVILAWLTLGEIPTGTEGVGIFLTVAGVFWVILAQDNRPVEAASRRFYAVGLLAALGGAFGQALGLLFSKIGLAGDFSALSGNLIRLIAASSVLWLATAVLRQVRPTIGQFARNRKARSYITLGAFTGPFLGVSFSLVAVQNTSIGVASALMALPPVLLLPVGYYVFGERFGWQAVAGTIVAVAGVIILFIRI
ncbi:MAG: DMT family transporter [Anaerolineales bacterium]|nr:DMT family transporter [Anaerolineales bacterium]